MPSSNGLTAADLRVRLLWLTVFRTIGTTLVLGVLAAQLASQLPRAMPTTLDYASFAIIVLSYVLTLVTGLLLRAGRVGAGVAWAQIVFDVLLASSVVSLTGGIRSPFTFLFLIAIVGAAVLLGTRGALAGFLGASVSLVGLPLLSGEGPGRVALDVVLQLLAQLLIAVLSGYVGEQLSRAGGQLDASERHLRSLIELQDEIVSVMPSGLITCDGRGEITFVNPAAEAILGIEQKVLVAGRSIDTVLPGVRGVAAARRTELKVSSSRGERTLGLTATPLADSEGLLLVFQDLTELRRVESELDRIDHLATLGRLSAQLAHEIRNPLAAMRGSAQMLVTDTTGTPGERLAKVIVRESDRLAELVEGYLKLARPPPPQMVPTRLDTVAHETLELLRSDPSFAAVKVEERIEAVAASGDASQLKQVLINLLRNAAVAIEQSRGRIRLRVASEQGTPVLEVWDSAGSLSPEDRPRVFEPFFTRARGGSGLGLSTVHSIVQAHGGSISVDSNPATGTTFSVKLQPSSEVAHGPHPGR